MDTPIYAPAAAYHAPVLQPYILSVDGCAIAELMADPPAWAIVLKYMPGAKFLVQSDEVRKLLDNMTLVDFSVFSGPMDPTVLANINTELARLPGARKGGQ